jgi:hypothetical protein
MNEYIGHPSNKNVPTIIVGTLTLCSQWTLGSKGLKAKINHWLWWKAVGMNDLCFREGNMWVHKMERLLKLLEHIPYFEYYESWTF